MPHRKSTFCIFALSSKKSKPCLSRLSVVFPKITSCRLPSSSAFFAAEAKLKAEPQASTSCVAESERCWSVERYHPCPPTPERPNLFFFIEQRRVPRRLLASERPSLSSIFFGRGISSKDASLRVAFLFLWRSKNPSQSSLPSSIH